MAFWAAAAPLIAAGMSSAAQMGGSIMSASGQASANAANVASQNLANQQMLNAQMAQHEQNTAFMEDQQHFNREERQYAEAFNAHQAQLAREFSSQEARTNRDFQEYMAGTSYRRAMIDMKAAGLNPILAYQQGGAPMASGAMGSGPSASSPGASSGMASAAAPPNLRAANVLNDKDAIGRAMGNLVSTAMSVLKSNADIDYVKQKEAESKEVEKNVGYDSAKKDMETIKIGREAEKVLEEKELIKAQTKNAKELSGVITGEAENMSRYGRKEAPDTMERLLRMLQGAIEQQGGKL